MKRFLYLIATDQLKGGLASIVGPFLQILSYVYHFVTTLKRSLYDIGLYKKHHLPCPVISVGNLTVGGTGKTPLIVFLVETLQSRDVDIAILTRGYMQGRSEKSDEVAMLQGRFPDVPILVGANRVRNAQAYLINNKADAFLLDDGLQHQRLFRDLEIIVIDTTNPWGNGYLLPRGILRESKSALRGAQIFVLTRTDLGRDNVRAVYDVLSSINPKALTVETIHKPVSLIDNRSLAIVDLGVISQKKVCVISSIGNPGSFVQTLTGLEANIGAHFEFMDHHIYTRQDIDRIDQTCRDQGIATIVTTEKDAVKLQGFWNVFQYDTQLLSLRIQIMFTEGGEQFLERISHIL